jgi:C1A family cysteine protease
MPQRNVKWYGWKPQLPDHRDLRLSAPVFGVQLPPSVNLTPSMPLIFDQGDLGSCTANAIAAAFEFLLRIQKVTIFSASRLFIYFNERFIEGTIGEDAGASLRDGMDSIHKQGVCDESLWPYDLAKFAVRPPDQCFTEALLHQSIQYLSVAQELGHLKACLAAGFPFVLGISVFASFESEGVAKSGIVPMPANDEACLGGHAVCCVGYDDAKGAFLVRNSWGADWGDAGHFWLPYSYMTNPGLASDFWTMRSVE